jgi:lipoyl(octanoyl) transferase
MNSSATIPFPTREASLEVYLLGLVDFDACLHLQERLATEVAERNDGHAALLVCEHPPLVTIGREGSQEHILCEPGELVARQIDVRRLNRGGGAIVHIPGQLAAYPIVSLAARRLGLVSYRERLERAVVDVCHELLVSTTRQDDRAGVWGRHGQIAQLGVAVRGGVTSHGLFVNVSPRMDALRLVESIGGRQSSLAAERMRVTSMHSVRESLVRNLAARLKYERYHLYTGHPLLKRTRRVVAYA